VLKQLATNPARQQVDDHLLQPRVGGTWLRVMAGLPKRKLLRIAPFCNRSRAAHQRMYEIQRMTGSVRTPPGL
jgi:hypothetical protein